MIRGPREAVLVGTLVAALAFASACGDDDDDSGGGGAPDAGSAPIKVMTWQSLTNPNFAQPQVRTAAEAAVRAINDSGGVEGRPLQLEFCDTNFDPNTEAACARQAVEGGFVAVVGSTTFFPNTLPLLERGGVAHIGGMGITPSELTNPISFPLGGAIPGWLQGAAAMVLEKGAQRPALVTSPLAATEFGAAQVQTALETAGVELIRTVNAPVGAPDQTTAAVQAAEGSDAVIVVTVPGDAAKIVQSLRQINYSGLIAGSTATFADLLETLGEASDRMQLTSTVTPISETDDPEVADFNQQMDAVDSNAAKDERAQLTWSSYQFVAALLQGIDGDITASAVLDAMRNLSEAIPAGMLPPYSVKNSPSPIAEFPQLHNPTVKFTEVRDGRIVEITGDFIDPYAVLRRIGGN